MPFASLVASSPLLQPWCLLASRLTSSRCHPGITQQGMVSSKRWSLVSHPPASKPQNHETPLEGMHSEPIGEANPFAQPTYSKEPICPLPSPPPQKITSLEHNLLCNPPLAEVWCYSGPHSTDAAQDALQGLYA